MAINTEMKQIQRMLIIFNELNQEKYPTKTTLANIIGCSTDAIGRDIKKMRDEDYPYRVPMEFDNEKNGWYLTDTSYKFEALKITGKELFSLFVVEQVMQQYKGTQIYPALQGLIKRIEASSIDEQGIFPIERFDNTLTAKSNSIRPIQESVWNAITTSIKEHKKLEIKHASAFKKNNHKPYEPVITKRILIPAKIVISDNNWYLIAWDERREEVRNFGISRIQEAKIINEIVAPDSEQRIAMHKEIEEISQNQFGVFLSKDSYDIELLFTPYAAPYIFETDWPKNYILPESLSEGESLTMKFKSNNLIEVTKWVLSFGENAKVINPPELLQTIKEKLQKAINQY